MGLPCRWKKVCLAVPFILLAAIALIVVVLSSSVIQGISIVSRNVTVNNANVSLSLGALGYCLNLNSSSPTCSKPKFLYVINETEVLAQVKLGTTITQAFSVANVVAFVGALGTLLLAYGVDSSACLRNTARAFAGIGAVVALVGIVFGVLFITNSPGNPGHVGTGLEFTIYAIVVLGLFAVLASCCANGGGGNEKKDAEADEIKTAQARRAKDLADEQNRFLTFEKYAAFQGRTEELNQLAAVEQEESKPKKRRGFC